MALKAVKILKHFESPKEAGVHYRLTCLTGANKGKAYFFQGNRVVLGRSENADIQVLDLKSSREHAEVTRVANDFIVTDLGSQNGIVINDLKVKQHKLHDGDKLIIGKTVYKFSKILVEKKEKNNVIPLNKKKENDNLEDNPPEKKRTTLMLAAVCIIAVMIILEDDSKEKGKEGKTKTSQGTFKLNEVDDPFAKAIKQKRVQDKKNQEKLNLYFQRGLREYREGNFFRAIAEFEAARQWSPGDPLAKFYLRKTREELNSTIQDYFNKAARDEEAVKYSKAIVSYCAVIRLLYQYPEDERYKNAEEKIKNLEVVLGMAEGEVQCLGSKGADK